MTFRIPNVLVDTPFSSDRIAAVLETGRQLERLLQLQGSRGAKP